MERPAEANAGTDGSSPGRASRSEDVFWVKLLIQGEPPSDAIPVRVPDSAANASVHDLKMCLLAEINTFLPDRVAAPWITLKLPAKQARGGGGGGGSEDSAVEASTELRELPTGAGGKDWHFHAVVWTPGDRGSHGHGKKVPAANARRAAGGATLFERGIAGVEEPDHIKDALSLTDLYPGGVLPRSKKETFSVEIFLKVVACFFILGLFYVFLMFLLEKVPRALMPQIVSPLSQSNHTEL